LVEFDATWWLQGGGAVICAILATGQQQEFVFILIATVLGLIFLSSLTGLKPITRDLGAGVAEEVLGSVQKRERSILDGIPSLMNLVPATDLARTVPSVADRSNKLHPALWRSEYSASDNLRMLNAQGPRWPLKPQNSPQSRILGHLRTKLG